MVAAAIFEIKVADRRGKRGGCGEEGRVQAFFVARVGKIIFIRGALGLDRVQRLLEGLGLLGC